MGEQTGISWTDHTFNPWWGCTKVSPACDFCYAERDSIRYGFGDLWGTEGRRRLLSDNHWTGPLKWNEKAALAGTRHRVFCASMADVFDNHTPNILNPLRARLWHLIGLTEHLDWLLLTKRVGNIARMVPGAWHVDGWPKHVWLGISICNQEELDRDVPRLAEIPAAVRFLSCEPLLGPLDFSRTETFREVPNRLEKIDWVITGGESGPLARPSHPDWFRGVRDQVIAAGKPFHFKQWGEWNVQVNDKAPKKPDALVVDDRRLTATFPDGTILLKMGTRRTGRRLDGREWLDFPKVAA